MRARRGDVHDASANRGTTRRACSSAARTVPRCSRSRGRSSSRSPNRRDPARRSRRRGEQGSVGDVVLVISLASQVNQQVTQAVFLLVGLQRISRTLANLAWIRELVEGPSRSDLALPRTIKRGISLRDVSFPTPARSAPSSAGSTSISPRTHRRDRRRERRRKDDARQAALPLLRADRGTIEMDGVDMRGYPLDDWRERIAAGFQDFARFEFVAREVDRRRDLPGVDTRP